MALRICRRQLPDEQGERALGAQDIQQDQQQRDLCLSVPIFVFLRGNAAAETASTQ